jgi:hypothetical protein
MAKKYLELNAGKVSTKEATVISGGGANAGEIPALDGTGRLDVSVLPLGVGPDLSILEASEDLTAGQYVNIYNVGGVAKARLADGSNGREAHGFVKSSYTTGQSAHIYYEGPNEALTSLTVGARYYLNTAGSVSATPRSAGIHQFMGVAVSATAINTDIEDHIVLN